MGKITSFEELKKLREATYDNTAIRIIGENPDRIVIAVGMSECGIAAGAKNLVNAFLDEIDAQKIDIISVIATDCFGECDSEPIVELRVPEKPSVKYTKVTEALVKDIIKEALLGREVH